MAEWARRIHELNPDADFSKAGTKIVVADTGKDAQGEVGRVEVTKEPGRLFAYAADGGLVCRLPRYRGQRAAPLALGTPRGKAIALDVT